MNRRGFAPIIILLVVAGVLVIGGVWYWYHEMNNTYNVQVPLASSTATSSGTQPKKIDIDTIDSQNGQLSQDVVVNGTKLKIIRSGLQLYFQDHGNYPNSLDQLTPKYFQNGNLAGSPILDDYVTKQEFTYAFTADNFEVCGGMGNGDLMCAHRN